MLNKTKQLVRDNLYRKQTGNRGEKLAINYLEKQGYQILKQNFTIRGGEIDLIAQDGEQIVFVEVKTRYSHQFGLPEESLSYFKLQALQRTARVFLHLIGQDDKAYRFDLVAVDFSLDQDYPEIRLIKNII